jgi:hypothetical protein
MAQEFVGWEVELANNKIIREGQLEWTKVPKRGIIRLSLFHYGGKRWDLSGKEAYFVKHRASVIPGVENSFRLERRTIGYYEGCNKICYHVEEFTGKFNLEVINTNER